jgi:diguanylate cyclase (GGDEF)-like protein/PAS domain S-box-containing protein
MARTPPKRQEAPGERKLNQGGLIQSGKKTRLLQMIRLTFRFIFISLALVFLGAAISASGPHDLSPEEKRWLDQHAAELRVAPELNYPPFSFYESGVWRGLSVDMLRLVEQQLGQTFTPLPGQSLDTILTLVKRGEVDVVTSLKETPERSKTLLFTPPYFNVPTVILVRDSSNATKWPASFVDKRIGVGKGYGVQSYLEKNYPALTLTLVQDDLEGMRKLTFGELDAMILDVASASYLNDREKLSHLRVLSSLDFSYTLSFAVRKDLPVLHQILTKALAAIPEKDKTAIFNQWVRIKLDPLSIFLARYSQWLGVLGASLLLLLGIGFVSWMARHQRIKAEQLAAHYARNLIEASLDPLITINPKGKITDVNRATEQITGLSRAHLINSNFSTYFIDPDKASEGYQQVFTKGALHDYPLALRHVDGRITEVLFNASLFHDLDGLVVGVVASARDITERKLAEDSLQAVSVFTHAREGIMITNAAGDIINTNEAFTRITGYSREEVLGKNPRLLNSGLQNHAFYEAMFADLARKGHWYGEIWNRRKNGDVFAEMLTTSVVRDDQGHIQHYVAMFSDITSMKEHERQLEHIAHFDTLTGLPNRTLLADRLQQAMAQAHRHQHLLAVVFLDLDGFKGVNDKYGHQIGDKLLIALAQRMKLALRDGDTLSRLGGDEFVAVFVDLTSTTASVPLFNRLLTAAAQPVHLGGLTLQVSGSLGVTFYPQTQEVDADQLLRQADQAMYQVKQTGKNRFHVFDPDKDISQRGHNESIERIRQALLNKEFLLYYQPKVNMRTGKVVGVEALIRWQHPDKGLLTPGHFLPFINDHPLAIELGKWVLDTALTQLESWRTAGLKISVSVNVSARELQQADFVKYLRAVLSAHPSAQPEDLQLEVLETNALEDLAHVAQVIEACREIGVMFALDDFGTGYSSLTYLKRLQVFQLKIDQSFVSNMLNDPDDLSILEGVIGLATAFRREVIAEGLELKEHGAMLLQLGCDLAQGYGIARPMPAEALPAWIAHWRPEHSWGNLASVKRDELPLLFASVEHRAWVKAIEQFILGQREAPPSLDYRLSHFGHWLESEGINHFKEHPLFADASASFKEAFLLATELCHLHACGEKAQAQAKLAGLHAARDVFFRQVQLLLQARQA